MSDSYFNDYSGRAPHLTSEDITDAAAAIAAHNPLMTGGEWLTVMDAVDTLQAFLMWAGGW